MKTTTLISCPAFVRNLKSWKPCRVLALFAVLLIGNSARAGVFSWNITTTPGSWSTAANWTGSPAAGGPSGAGDVDTINTDISAATTINLFNTGDSGTAAKTVGVLNIGDANATHSFTVAAGSGTGSFIFDNSGAGAQINELSTSKGDTISASSSLLDDLIISNASVNTLTLSGSITAGSGARTITNSGAGTGGVTISGGIKAGAGTIAVVQNSASSLLSLTGVNTFTGGVSLKLGTLKLGNASSLGATAGVFNIGDTTGSVAVTLDVTTAVSISTANAQNWNQDFTFGGANTLNLGLGAVTLAGSRVVTASASTLTVGGVIGEASAGFSLTKSGAGTMILNGSNTYSGGTIVNGGVLTVGAAGVLGSNVAGNAITVSNALLNLGASTNVGGNQTITVGSSSSIMGGLGLAFNSLPSIAQSGSNPILIGINTTGFTAISSESAVGNGYVFLGSTGAGTFAGSTLGSGTDGVYRLGGGGGVLTVTNGVLTGNNNLLVNSTLVNGNGTVILQGSNNFTGTTVVNSGTLSLSGSFGSVTSSAVTVNSGATLIFDSSASGVSGATRASSVTLSGAPLNVTGNSGGNSVDSITGVLTIGAPSSATGVNVVTLTPNAASNTQLSAGSLVRNNNGVVLFRGTNLGANTIASHTANTSNIVFTTAPTGQLVGGGGSAGSQNISILPWAIGDASATGTGSSFVTYDANGIRPLAAGEYDTALPAVASTNNVSLAIPTTTTTTVNGATTVNSLLLTTSGAGASGILAGTGTLTITSGAMFANFGATGLAITKPIDFGSAQGVIGTNNNSAGAGGLYIFGGIAGSGGVVFYTSPTDAGNGIVMSGSTGVSNTYTGDTYIMGNMWLKNTTGVALLPNGSRTGDVYIYGTLTISSNTNGTGYALQINGLNGTGNIQETISNANTLIVGDNNANGNFSGGMLKGNGSFQLTKIGSGTQILSGTTSTRDTGQTNIQNGILSVITLNSVVGGAASSSLGAPVISSNGTINFGSAANTGQLTVVGTGETTDRVINLAGTTGGAIIDQSGTGLLKFTASSSGSNTFTATGAGSKTLTLQGSTTGTGEIAAAIINNSATNKTSLTKAGTGTWTLSGTSTYTGATNVNGGTLVVSGLLSGTTSLTVANSGSKLQLGANNVLNTASTLTLNTGILDTQGHIQTLGVLTSTGASVLNLGTGASVLNFADSSSQTWSGTLSIYNWTGATVTGGGADQVIFAAQGLTQAQLNAINFYSDAGTTFLGTAGWASGNINEIVAIPEPQTWAMLVGGLGMLIAGQRIRRRSAGK